MSIKGKILNFSLETMVKIKKPAVSYDGGQMSVGIWYRIPVADTISSDGSQSLAYIKKGTTNKLIVFFVGGGMSWDADSAKRPTTVEALAVDGFGLYNPSYTLANEWAMFMGQGKPGILHSSKDNVFSDWNIIAVNYTTGDFHVGNNEFHYTDAKGQPQILHHKGLPNFTRTMVEAKKFFPDASKLLIAGNSAGAFAVPALAKDVMDVYPDCDDVTVCADSSLLHREDWKDVIKNVWKSTEPITDAAKTVNLSADWFEMLYNIVGDKIRFLFTMSCRDNVLVAYEKYFETGSIKITEEECDLFVPKVREHVERLKQLTPQFGIYINDFSSKFAKVGTDHCSICCPLFTNNAIDGVTTAKWLSDAVNGNVYDVGLRLLS